MMTQKENQTMNHIISAVIGMGIGIIGCILYLHFPSHRIAILLLAVIAAVLVLLYGVKRKCRQAFEKQLLEIKNDFEAASGGTTPLRAKEGMNEGVRSIYESAEEIRHNLRKKEILQRAALDITNSMAVNLEFFKLIDVVMSRLVEEMDSNWGVFYVYHPNTEKLELKKALGLSKKVYSEFDVVLGEGIIGAAAQSGKIEIYHDIPEDTIFKDRTFLGEIVPKSIIAVPIKSQEKLVAVAAFGSLHNFTPEQLELLKLILLPMGYAVVNSLTYETTQSRARELQLQNQMIQKANDEIVQKIVDEKKMAEQKG